MAAKESPIIEVIALMLNDESTTLIKTLSSKSGWRKCVCTDFAH